MSNDENPPRLDYDSLGAVEVPSERLWGAQTERSRRNFRISHEKMPEAVTNLELGVLEPDKPEAIVDAADEVLAGMHPDEFPLLVWQTGSGAQSNLNVNEVLANRASELLGGERAAERLVHPNDDANRDQSPNDVLSHRDARRGGRRPSGVTAPCDRRASKEASPRRRRSSRPSSKSGARTSRMRPL